MMIRVYVVAALSALLVVGCKPGGEVGDPAKGSNPQAMNSSNYTQKRPGEAGGPPLATGQSNYDPTGGRSGAAAGQ